MQDKRIHRRFGPLVLKTTVDIDGETREGYLTNISTSGAFLAIDTLVEVGTELSLYAPLPWNLGELAARARVVWHNDPNSSEEESKIAGVGLAFTYLDEDSADRLDGYLQRFVELAAKLDESPPPHEGH